MPGGTGGDSRLHPARPFLAVSLAVFRGDHVLLARRAQPPAVGAFSLPGGMVETGETLAEAAIRECREEVGVRANVEGIVEPVEYIERDEGGRVARHFVVLAHWGEWLEGEPHPGAEAAELMWMSESDLGRLEGPGALPTTPRLADVLRQAFALRQSRRNPV